ncbi:MAG TPA: hypothetical protein PLS49_04815 [Candidatus Woesebacteria bacterium]|nr:hypothetical protein [Candidatus Woesebacteria bacterium]
MNKLKTITRIKMFVAIIAAYLFVSIGSPQIFLTNSPELRPDFIARLQSVPQTVYAFARYPLNAQNRNNAIGTEQVNSRDDKADLEYQSIAPGVYAAEDPVSKEVFYKFEKGTKVDVREVILSDGRTVKVYIPVR